MNLLPPFILQNFKKFLERFQSYEDVPFSSPKWSICPEQILFGRNHYHCAKFKKNSYCRPRVMRMHHFGAQNGPFAPNKFFFLTIINIILIYLSAPFIEKNFFLNSSNRSRVMRMHNFWIQNGPFPQMRIFSENLLMSLVSFIHPYLHVKNQSETLIY